MTFETEILFLRERIVEYGLKLSPVQSEHFRLYLFELMDWGRKMNLTGLSDTRRVISELFFDSLIPTPFLPCQGKMLDVGSGAGIPALPIKILLPDLETHLLEPNQKKISFLKHIIRLLKIERITVIKGRIEQDGARLLSGGYDLVTVRALTHLQTAISWCAPFLKPEGLMVSFLGADSQLSIRQARDQIEKNDLILKQQIDYRIPENQTERHIVIFQKKQGFSQ